MVNHTIWERQGWRRKRERERRGRERGEGEREKERKSEAVEGLILSTVSNAKNLPPLPKCILSFYDSSGEVSEGSRLINPSHNQKQSKGYMCPHEQSSNEAGN